MVPSKRKLSLFPVLLLPVFFSLLLAAHFSRIKRDEPAVFCLLFPLLLFRKREWIIKVYQLLLLVILVSLHAVFLGASRI